MSTTENSLPPDDMPVTPNSEPSQTDSVLKVPPRHQASTGEIAGNPEGSNEAPHSTISPRQARQRLNVPMPNMEVLAIDTDSKTLDIGVGHLLGSSLPVGGKGTHTVLTGHSGMATQKMFSDLDKLKLGDVFYLQVLDETLAYQVDAIHTVLPYDTSFLGITEGEDYCTLVTCTPFGINTHRLLVRGTRIPYEEAEVITAEKLQVEDTPASTWEQQYIKGILLGIATVAVILVFCIWGSHCQKRRRRRKTRQREQFRPRKRGKYEKA